MRLFIKPVLSLALLAVFAFGCEQNTDLVSSSEDALRYDALDAVFTDYDVVTLDNRGILDHSAANKETGFRLDLNIPQKPNWSFDVKFHDFYDEDFRAYESSLDGGWVEVPVGDDRSDAFYGTTPDDEDVHGMFIMMDNNLEGEVYEGDIQYGLNPLTQYVPNAGADKYVLYRLDADIAGNAARCGNDDAEDSNDHGVEIEGKEGLSKMPTCYDMTVNYVADYEMYNNKFSRNTTNMRNWIENRIKFGSYRYWGYNSFPLYFRLYTRYVRTNTSNRPMTSTNSATALQQFINWSNNTNNMRYADEHLIFTGRNFGTLFGRARLDANCRFIDGVWASRGMVTKNSGISSAVYSKVTGHEVGHNLSARHKTSGFMQQGNHTNRSMPSATRNELTNHTNAYNSCLSNRECISYRGL